MSNKFDELFNLETEDQIEVDAYLLASRFLSVVEEHAELNGLTRGSLAELVGVSAPYLSQVFRGNKLMNLTLAAKFQRALKFEFSIDIAKNYQTDSKIDPKALVQYINYLPPNKSKATVINLASYNLMEINPIKDLKQYIPDNEKSVA